MDRSGYRLLRVRGQGAFGQVWEAQASDGQLVALKLVALKSTIRNPATVVTELRNTQKVSLLRHPNLVQIEKVWCEEGQLYVVMELADASLQDVIEICFAEFGVGLPADLVCMYLEQVASALDFLNLRRAKFGGVRAGLQHCDVKPGNMLLFGETVKLCDYGLASLTSSPVVRSYRCGTPAFSAPEIFQGWLSDWTDQYSLAVSYCYLRSGRFPFTGPVPSDFAANYQRPSLDLEMLDAREKPAITRGMAPVPQDRWSSCGEMMRQISQKLGPRQDARSERRIDGLRHPCASKPLVRIVKKGLPGSYSARISDISRWGVGVAVEQSFDVGTEFLLLFPLTSANQKRILSARVAWTSMQTEGGWLLGCRLTFPISQAEIDSLSQQPKSKKND